MPSVSKKQQNFFRIVKAYKDGKIKKKDVSKSVVDAAKGMTKKQISHFADHRVKKYKVKKLDEMFGEITERMKIVPITNDEFDRVSDKIEPKHILKTGDLAKIKNYGYRFVEHRDLEKYKIFEMIFSDKPQTKQKFEQLSKDGMFIYHNIHGFFWIFLTAYDNELKHRGGDSIYDINEIYREKIIPDMSNKKSYENIWECLIQTLKENSMIKCIWKR